MYRVILWVSDSTFNLNKFCEDLNLVLMEVCGVQVDVVEGSTGIVGSLSIDVTACKLALFDLRYAINKVITRYPRLFYEIQRI